MNRINLIVAFLLAARTPMAAQPLKTSGLGLEWLVPLQSLEGAHNFKNGLAFYKKDTTTYCINKQGKIIASGTWNVKGFSEGLILAEIQNRFGFMDTTFQWVIPCQYRSAEVFQNGLARVVKDGRTMFINKTGQNAFPFTISLDSFPWVLPFADGFAVIQKYGQYYTYIHQTGKFLIPLQASDKVASNFSEGLAPITKHGKTGFMDTTGQLVIPFRFDFANGFEAGWASVTEGDKRGFINRQGEWVFVLKEGWFAWYGFKENGLCVSNEKNLIGFIDRSGQVVTPFQFQEVQLFSEGLAGIKQGERWGFMDKTGRVVIPPQFDAISPVSEGHFIAKQGDKYGIVQIKESPASLHWQYPMEASIQSRQTTYPILLCIESGTLPKMTLRVDGKIVEPVSQNIPLNATPNCVYQYAQLLKLSPRDAPYKIEFEVQNQRGTLRSTRDIQVLPSDAGMVVDSAFSDKRLALVIGNGRYSNIRGLGVQPLNDAADIATALQTVGFKVIRVADASKQVLETQINLFVQELAHYEVGLLFYAGHGLAIGGKNYIVPVDFPKKATKADVAERCIETGGIQHRMASAGKLQKTNILILDACRDEGGLRTLGDPTVDTWTPPERVPTGFITCYAASLGQQADNGNGRNGLYTGILLKHLLTPNLKIEDLFKRVRIELLEQGGQEPEEATQLTKDFYFNARF